MQKNEKSKQKRSKVKTRMVGGQNTALLFVCSKSTDGLYFPDSDWDCGEETFQDGDDMLGNTLLIIGPTGVGKTAAVYACAQELGFKVQTLTDSYVENVTLMLQLVLWLRQVFEVNASSQRSGRLILSQLKEATQSHQVDNQGVNAHKPTYFNSCNASSSTSSLRTGSSPSMQTANKHTVSVLQDRVI